MGSVEDAAQRLLQSERVTVKAVMVADDEDPAPHLLAAGIVEPVSIPFAFDDDGATPASMGDGWTPGVTGILEFDDEGGADSPPFDAAEENLPSTQDDGEPEEPRERTANLPGAFGMSPMAPVWRRT